VVILPAAPKRIAGLAVVLFAVTACQRSDRPPAPTFNPVFPNLTGEYMTFSSPALADLDRDGVDDIVFGTGIQRVVPVRGKFVIKREPAIPGYVIAVSGRTNQLLWRAANAGDGFTTARFEDLNGDQVPDVIMGGREGSFSAFNGNSGALLWRVAPDSVGRTNVPYNFFSPAIVPDANGDGVRDFVVVYGGDDTKVPDAPRDPSYLALVSGANGKVLAVQPTPDGAESYSSVVVYDRRDGKPWLVFGTGGESMPGAAYRAPLASLLDKTLTARAERIVAPGSKGVIAPATIVELTGDQEPDIVISTFDGRLIVVDGASGKMLWEKAVQGEETYHPAAVVRIARAGTPGLLVSRGVGTFPRYAATTHRLYRARDGQLLYEYRDLFYPAGAPLAVDLTGDGIDEPIFFSFRYRWRRADAFTSCTARRRNSSRTMCRTTSPQRR
jgi:outer membrane protein assembly factor BamB